MSLNLTGLPALEMTFAAGGVFGMILGFWAGYSVQNFASYSEGFKDGRSKSRKENEND